jgi:hypothetical protein
VKCITGNLRNASQTRYNGRMSTKAIALADKLTSEGERTLAFFRALPVEAWSKRTYVEGPGWTVRDTFEHLILSEQTLQQLFEQIVREGRGVAEGFSVDAFNAAHTGELAALSWDDLQARYAETRRRTAAFTRDLTDEQLSIRARHPALGDSTLEEMLKLIHLHHTMHVRDVRKM